MAVLLIVLVVFEIVKRAITPFFYWCAYVDRKKLRINRDQDKIGFLWYLLDDSVRNYNLALNPPIDVEYKSDDHPHYAIVPSSSAWTNFWRSFLWGALRNNCINLTHAWSAGEMNWSVTSFYADGKSFYRIGYYNHGRLPYLEYWIGAMRLQLGWLSNGRWQVQFRNPLI